MNDFKQQLRVFLHPVCSALVATLVLVGCSAPPPPAKEQTRPVKAIQLATGQEFEGRAFPGTAKATQEVELSFRVSGPLIALPIQVGQTVKKGDVLAQIDPRDYQVKLRNVRGQMEEAKAALTRTENDLKRQENILKQDPGATSERAIDRAREGRDRSRANLSSLEASLTAANDQLSYTRLKAPFSGTVVATYVENFEDVRAKQPVARVVDDSRIEMVVNIPENLISMVPDVQNVRVTFDTFPDRTIPAEIKEIGTEASAITRTYPVTLIMDQPDDVKILPGMSGRVTGDPPEEMVAIQGALMVPVSATFAVGDETFVWVIDEATNTVSKRKIATGMVTNLGIGVTEGLSPGEWIATAGVHFLAEGQSVRILDQDAG
ncbi:MAG: efflux RND transporter periplasmic adaptor subunit [Gammaproteobacteria bacterium]|nr:efflux RND transporter periplasmic adaptor subunit [Gammaproteobacteria bacterium]